MTGRAQGFNPYQPPIEEEGGGGTDVDDLDGLVEATNGRRFGTYVIDTILSALLVMVIAFVLGVFTRVSGFNMLGWTQLPLGPNVFGIATVALYYVVFEFAFARTPGKLICGTRVVRVGGGPLRFGQVIGRSFARLIPFEPFSAFSGGGMWHDTLSGTRVVQNN